MIRSAKRWLAAIASASLMAAGLPAAATTAAQAAAATQQAGPFWPGNLLSMSNADFENGPGKWNAITNSTLTTGTDAFLHHHSLKIVAAAAGPSVIQLNGAGHIQINLPSTSTRPTYRVGAYIKTPANSSHTTAFDLNCYNSAGQSLGWSLGTPVTNSGGTWQWVKDDIQLPSGCAYVQDSPRVRFTGMHAGGYIYMDEAWFAPERAALMIGAYAPKYSAWNTNNTSIGPLQSDKIFFGGSSAKLPATWDSSTNQCHELEHGTNKPPVCVINLNPPPDASGSPLYSETQIQDFLAGMPGNQTVIMVYRGEAEHSSFSGCPGSASGNAANFKCYFEKEVRRIRTAASAATVNRTRNVFTADDSASAEYGPGGVANGCNWIVNPSYVDVYLEDHYERGWADGSNLSVQSGNGDPKYNGQGPPQWNNWLNCVKSMGGGKPIGLAEYGLCSDGGNCSNGATGCKSAGSSASDEETTAADNTYLANEPSGNSPTLLWNYWYAHCWHFTDPAGITEWQSIENQNGGAVGG